MFAACQQRRLLSHMRHPPFNLFRDEGQPSVANLSDCLPTERDRNSRVPFPFAETQQREVAELGRIILLGRDDVAESVLPVMLLMGPGKPVTASKRPYIDTLRRIAEQSWNVPSVPVVPMQRLRDLAVWHRQSGAAKEDADAADAGTPIVYNSRRKKHHFRSDLAPGLYPFGQQQMEQQTEAAQSSFGFGVSGGTLMLRFLQPIRLVWPWLVDSLSAISHSQHRVIFLSGLAEMLDTPSSCAREVAAFVRQHMHGALLVDGTSSGNVSYPGVPSPLHRDAGPFEKLLGQLGGTVPSVLPSMPQGPPVMKISLDGMPSMSDPKAGDAVPDACPAATQIVDGICRVPLNYPSMVNALKDSRSNAVQKATQLLSEMLEQDARRHRSREHSELLASKLGVVLTEAQQEKIDATTGLHAVPLITESDVKRVSLLMTSLPFVEALQVLAPAVAASGEAVAPPSIAATLGSLSKHETRLLPSIVTPDMVQTRFDDIGSLKHIKQALHELISLPLLRPELFSRGVAKEAVSGVLLFGPPGTGKTMLARAVAVESGSNFLAVSMSSIFDMWVGEGEKNVKAVFTLARRLAPCIVFVDEVDALLESRQSHSSRSNRNEIINEFMAEWDGLNAAANRRRGVIVMAATNRPFVLDDAVLRRLPRRLLVDLPDREARESILDVILKEDNLANRVRDIRALAEKTTFYSGSDLKNLALSAAFAAIRENPTLSVQPVIEWRHWERALEEVPASLSKSTESLKQLRTWNDQFGDKSHLRESGEGKEQSYFAQRRTPSSIGFKQ